VRLRCRRTRGTRVNLAKSHKRPLSHPTLVQSEREARQKLKPLKKGEGRRGGLFLAHGRNRAGVAVILETGKMKKARPASLIKKKKGPTLLAGGQYDAPESITGPASIVLPTPGRAQGERGRRERALLP